MRYVLRHPSETRPSVIIHTCAAIDARDIESLRDDMYGAGCTSGLLFDADRCAILRDTFGSMTRDSIVEDDVRPSTIAVLARAGGGTLDERVGRWLEMMASNWHTALPMEPAVAAPFITEIVPAASGSVVQADAVDPSR